jgi:hypothetical protein
MLSLGPVLIPAGLGLLAARAIRPRGNIVASALLSAIAVVVLYLVRLRVDVSWVGFRAGQIFLVASPSLIACGLASGFWRRVTVPVATLAFCIGLPTTVVDVYNAQDISNLSPGPGFPWTEVLDRAHEDALDWLRRATPSTATVQLDPVARGRTTWSIIPSFAERRMAAGLPRTLVDDPEYHDRSERVRVMYTTGDAREAWTIARALRINYVYVDGTERRAYPLGVSKFDTAPGFFAPVFRNAEVTIYRVQ